jgi:hypothetical protein
MELDVNNLDTKLKNKKLLKGFDFVFNYLDTTTTPGKKYLPVFITETLSDYSYQRKPARVKEEIKASKTSGFQAEGLSQYTGQMYADVNIYKSFIELFGKSFVSPMNNAWKLYYKYSLDDSAYIDGHHSYLIRFKPQRRKELTFSGQFWVSDTTWAITNLQARIADDANLNYLKDFAVQLKFQQQPGGQWFLIREEVFAEMTISDKTAGFLGRKTTTRANIRINPKYDSDFFSRTQPQESIIESQATSKDTSYWAAARHEKLSEKESNIYQMVDSIKQVPVFKTFSDIVSMLTLQYLDLGKWEWGPYFKSYSHNPIEGSRFRFGGRTSEEMFDRLQIEAYGAYGTTDNRFKYGVSLLYVDNDYPRRSFTLKHKYDIEQLGLSANAFTEDNILSTILSRSPNDKLLIVRDTRANFMQEWFLGFSTNLTFTHKTIFPSELIPFKNTTNEISSNSLTTTEMSLDLRLAYNEKFIGGRFNRVSLGSEYPVVSLIFAAAPKNILGSKYAYYRSEISISHHLNVGPLGFLKYQIKGGKIFGTVPYPLLKLHEGNGTYALDLQSFNLMNFYEFTSDTWASMYVEHHFGGLFLNKIPLLSRLKLREIIYGKILYGTLNKANQQERIYDFPAKLNPLTEPYIELGVGVENIFRVFRIDAIWRITNLELPDVTRFGIRASIQIGM